MTSRSRTKRSVFVGHCEHLQRYNGPLFVFNSYNDTNYGDDDDDDDFN